jgi:fatty acid desaturase
MAVMLGVGLLMAAIFGSALFWWRVLSRATGREDLVRKRRRLWQAHLWFGGVAAILLAALAALAAVTAGDGLLIVFVLGMWCAAGLALTVGFTLISYPVEFLLSWVARRPDRDGS